MGSLPVFPEEKEQLLGLLNSNAFLRTCSKPDLNWFMDAVTASLLKLVDESEARSSKESKQWLGAYTLGNLMLDPTTRTVSFTESKQLGKDHDNIFTVLAIFLTEFLAMALNDDYSETSKQSRFRTKIAMLFAVEGIHERLRSAFRKGGKSSHREVWALEVLKQDQRLQETIDGALYVAKPTTGIKEERAQHASIQHPLQFLRKEALNGAKGPPGGCEIFTRPPIIHMNGGTRSGNREVTVLVPAAGRSSRFPGHKPKWLLTQPNGCLMVVDALGALNMTQVARVVVGILRDHLDRFCGGDVNALLKAFDDGHKELQQIPVSIVVIPEETKDQIQTLECILHTAAITGPIFLKDCDNQFACPLKAIDGVATQEITGNIQSVSIPAAKSYITQTPNGLITNIAEKVILSNTFCIGGYSFRSASCTIFSIATARSYQMLTSSTNVELSVSDIVWIKMLMEQASFVSIPASSYEDWGTVDAWETYTRTWKTLFVDIDGTLLKNTGQYFKPRWSEGSGPVLPRNVKHLRSLHARGRTQIVLTTTRPETFPSSFVIGDHVLAR